MRGGSYAVVRRIRIALEHWDRTEVDFQQEVVGRHKYSGAPLGGKNEFDTPNFDRADSDGNPVIPETAHIRLGAAESNGGAEILRRSYAYNDGSNFTAERWPPWRQGIEYDAGLFFIAYQSDPRNGFVHIFEKMSKLDAMNQYTTHVGSGLFACPAGIVESGYCGQMLFEA
jgi:deferrochelatase/peroxidase EfeB